MEIVEFQLETWFDKHETEAELHLAEGHLRGLSPERFELNPGPLEYVIPTDGDPKLRNQISDRYGRSKNEVLFTCGAQEANLIAVLSLLGDCDHAIVVTPTYQSLLNLPNALAEVTRIELQPPEWNLEPVTIRDAIRPNTSLIVFDNPNNPIGKYHPQSSIERIYEIANEHDVDVLCDETNRKLVPDPYDPIATLGEHGISTSSLTKPFGLPGIRFGWLGADREVIKKAHRWKRHTTISPPIIGQHIAKQALEREKEILEENRELVEKNKEFVMNFISDHNLNWFEPTTSTGFITIPRGFDNSRDFCNGVVEKEGVLFAPGDVFGYDSHFRIGFGISTETLKDGLERTSRFIEETQG